MCSNISVHHKENSHGAVVVPDKNILNKSHGAVVVPSTGLFRSFN